MDRKRQQESSMSTAKQSATTVITYELSVRDIDTMAGGGSSVTFGIEQVPTIGSQSSGAGAGKVKFNPFAITR
jgi:hypothetical protein